MKCVEECILLLFAAKHHQYGLFYLRMMERLPDHVREDSMNGHHIIHLNSGIWNGLWGDMGIETTWMNKGHGPDEDSIGIKQL